MTRKHLQNFAAAVAIAAVLSCGHLLDGPNDTQAARASSISLQNALKAAKAEQHKAQATKVAGVQL